MKPCQTCGNAKERTIFELKIGLVEKPLTAVEVRLDGPAGADGQNLFRRVLAERMQKIARDNPKLTATFYSYYTDSVNFGSLGFSLFIGVKGPRRLLDEALAALRKAGFKARYSDSIPPGDEELHLQDGAVWLPEDAEIWSCQCHTEEEKRASDVRLENCMGDRE